ncbi:MAG: hypothetical protein COA82_03655 [Alkaliphilus sp.]|nr:MAG: hypothetical protein COA82_03655 [Alkaliphilus sp.]
MSGVPNINHKLLSKDKTRKDYFVPQLRYMVDEASFTTTFHTRLRLLYKIAEGGLDPSQYSHVLNPANTQNTKLTKFPAKLRNYDIIKPIIEMFLGEFGRRPDDATVIAVAADAKSRFKEAKAEAVRANLAQQFINDLNEQGMETGVASQDVPPAEQVAKDFDVTYDDERAIIGQEALEVLRRDLDFDEKLQLMLYDWIVSGSVLTFKDVFKDDVDYVVCDPREFYPMDVPQSGFIEDAQGGVLRMRWSRVELVNRFNKEMEETYIEGNTTDDKGKKQTVLDWLMEHDRQVVNTGATVNMSSQNIGDSTTASDYTTEVTDKYNVYLCNWVGMEKIGVVEYVDSATGQIAFKDIDDTYKLDKLAGDLNIEWEWVNCWYQGYVIEDVAYLEVQKGIVQRDEINNTSTCKIAFNGRFRGYRSNTIQSVVNHSLDYQALYNTFHFRFEFALAKNKEKFMIMPMGLIPKKKGWDEDKWFYWANAHGIAWIDESAPGAMQALSALKSIDMGLGNYVQQMWGLLSDIKMELWDSLGINRQRYGDTQVRDGKATTEQAVFRSAIITDDFFRQLNKFLEKEYQGMIDYSKIAWRNGKKSTYIASDKQRVFFDIEDTEYMNTDYGIFVKNTQHEHEKIERAKAAVQTFGQNGMSAPIAIEMIDSNNMSKVKEIANKGLEIERAFTLSQQKQAEDSNERIQQSVAQNDEAARQATQYKVDEDNATKIEVAKIQANVDLQKLVNDSLNMAGQTPGLEGQDAFDNMNAKHSEHENQQGVTNTALQRENLAAKRSSDATKMAIAKENKNKYD